MHLVNHINMSKEVFLFTLCLHNFNFDPEINELKAMYLRFLHFYVKESLSASPAFHFFFFFQFFVCILSIIYFLSTVFIKKYKILIFCLELCFVL